jgi:hypothetical protein
MVGIGSGAEHHRPQAIGADLDARSSERAVLHAIRLLVKAASLCCLEDKRNHISIVKGKSVKDEQDDQGEGLEPRGHKDRRVRIDAQRTINALLPAIGGFE